MTSTAPLDPDHIRENLKTNALGSRVIVYGSTASTNDVAAEYARNPRNHGLLVLAEQQTAGRGRGANRWLASHSDSILASLVLIDNDLPSEWVSLTAAVAVALAIGPRARIKWPNDILIGGKKVCGILLESRPFSEHSAYILGLGINCHQQVEDFPPSLREEAISLDMVQPQRTDRVTLVQRFLVELEHWLGVARERNSEILQQWQQRCLQFGHRVTLCFNGRQYEGQCLGVDPTEGLILKLDHGGVRHFAAAQTHIIRK